MINVTGAGRLTKDSELRYTADGKGVLNFDVACDSGWGDRKSTVFLRCALWGARGESMEAWLKKGTQVTVTGALKQSEREYGGKTYHNLDVSVHELALQGGKRDNTTTKAPEQGFRDKKPPAASQELDEKLPF